MTSRIVNVIRTGKIDYLKGLNIQNSYAKPDNINFQNTLILTEHNPVYTIGIRTKGYSDTEIKHLESLGAQFLQTNRGGLITFHGPGQLVVYPILNLKEFKPSIKWFICQIEQTVIDVCKQFNLMNVQRTSDTGIWIENRKICAIGIHASRYITTHGLALNCTTDLTWFQHIIPCGIQGKGVTSLSNECNRLVEIEQVIPVFLNCFKTIFNCKLIEKSYD